MDKTLRDNIDNLSNPNSTSNAARELEHRVGEMIKAAKAGKPDAVEDGMLLFILIIFINIIF